VHNFRPRATGRLGWSAVGIVAVVGGAALTVHSPLFRAHAIDVSGTSSLTRTQVVRAAGVSPETNLFFADPSAIEARLEAQPEVAQATVVKALPSTLRIDVVERQPVVAVRDGTGFRLLAGDGTPLGVAGDDDGLPVLVRPAAPPPRRTATISPSAAAAALAPLPPEVRANVAAVADAADGGLMLRLRSGGVIDYGPASAEREKAGAIAALLRWARREGRVIDRADVSVPAAPTARLVARRRRPR
jgi:cell division protein FtsQ